MKYSNELKLQMIKEKRKGKLHPKEIFKKFGIEVKNKAKDYEREMLGKWERKLKKVGEKEFLNSGSGKTKILSKNWEKEIEKLSDKEKLKWMEAKIKLMEKESILFPELRNELKLEKRIIKLKEKRFKLIYEVKKENKEIDLSILLTIANVSKSGYYKYLKERGKREEKEKRNYLLIKDIYDQKKGKYGIQRIAMELNWNHKKVARIMRKFNLKAKIRRINKSRVSLSKNLENRYVSNILNREFKQKSPYRFLSTDITYLRYDNNKRWAFLSVIKDISSGEIITYKVSKTMDLNLVLDTIDKLEKYYSKNNLSLKNTLLHSDQGFQYTNLSYHNRLKDLRIIQSMSRRGNSIDNAIIETFFGHMKDEIETKNLSFNELEKEIDKYMIEYNYQRKQWDKEKMTPVEYRNHLLELNS